MKFTDRDGFTEEIPCPCDPPCDWERDNLCCVCKGSPTIDLPGQGDVVCHNCQKAVLMGMAFGAHDAFQRMSNIFEAEAELQYKMLESVEKMEK